MKLFELIKKLEEIAPNEMAEKWDNPGLLVGDDCDIKKVLIAVDASDYVIDTAIEQNVDLIITHHPLIFTGIKNVTKNDFIGRRVFKLARNNIALYAMHTNFDVCQMTENAGRRLGIQKEGIIEVTDTVKGDDAKIEEIGFGMYGKLGNEAIDVSFVANLVKERFEIDSVRVFGDLKRKISRVGIFPGSGKSSIKDAVKCNIDVLVTGDIDHHSGIDAVAQGMCVIDAGHYGIEKIFTACMADYFESELPEIDVLTIMDDEPFITV